MRQSRKIFIADIKTPSKDGTLGGHYVPVAKNYYEVFAHREIIVAGGPAYSNYFPDPQLCILPFNVSGSSFSDKLKTFINSIVLFWEARNQIIILQQSTVVTSFVALLFFYWRTSHLYLIQYNTEAISKWWYKVLYTMVSWKIDGTICPNIRIGESYKRPYIVVPDYINTSDVPQIGYEAKKYDFCMVGTIWPDKGVVEVARKLMGTEFKTIIAGAVADSSLFDELTEIGSKNSNIEMILRRVTDEEYKFIIQASRYCILNYQGGYNDRSSGVVLDMIYNGVPIIGHKCEALLLVEENNCGLVYENLDEWNPKDSLCKEKYDNYQNFIKKYADKQINEKNRLIAFVED